MSRDGRYRYQHQRPRSRTLDGRKMPRNRRNAPRAETQALLDGVLELYAERPRTRSDCAGGERPCPWVSCRHHLAVEVTAVGNLTVVNPDRDVDELAETCALDVADRGAHTLESVAQLLNVSRERARQIEYGALVQLRRRGPL